MEDAKRLADAVEKVQCFFSNLDFSPSPTPHPPPPPSLFPLSPQKKGKKKLCQKLS